MRRKPTPTELALWAALPMAHTSRIEGRLTMILDTTRSRRTLTRRVLIAAFGLGTTVLVPLAMLRPAARAQAAPVAPIEVRLSERNNPEAAKGHLRQIYALVGVYRRMHGGAFPVTSGPNSLAADMAAHPQTYGLPDQGAGNSAQAIRFFTSPDSPFVVYFLHNKRPDGMLVGTAKRPGTQDILADTNLYARNHAPAAGFYLVLWDDGTVGKIPAGKILAVPAYDVIGPAGATERARRQGEKQVAFPGQAGLPRG